MRYSLNQRGCRMPNAQVRELRRQEMQSILDALEVHGVAVDAVTREVMQRYIDGKVGLTHVSVALEELRRQPPSVDCLEA